MEATHATSRAGDGQATFPGRSPFEVDVEALPRAAVVRLHGSAGITEILALRDSLGALVARRIPVIVVDLSDLPYVTALAVSAVVAGTSRAHPGRDEIRLVVASARVLGVLARTRVAGSVRVCTSVAAALQWNSPSEDPSGDGSEGKAAASSTGQSGPMVRISVTGSAESVAVPVPVTKGRGGVLEQLTARFAGSGVVGHALPQPS
jgi:anti-anti-sigma regulatory factor